jgi:hypothetical protein
MDTINKEWVIQTSDLADLYEAKEIELDKFTDDQLHYLIYWNFGYSGPVTVNETKEAEAELIRRGRPFNVDRAAEIADITEELY